MTKNRHIQNARRAIVAAALASAPLLASACNQAVATTEAARAPRKENALDQDIEKLKQAEQTWVNSLTQGDPALLATIIDREFSFIGPDGEFEKRDAYLAGYESLPKLGVVVESVDLHEVSYRVLGDVGIVTGRALAQVKIQSNPLVENVRFTRVYRRGERGWVMVAGQGTRIPAAPAPAPGQG